MQYARLERDHGSRYGLQREHASAHHSRAATYLAWSPCGNARAWAENAIKRRMANASH